MRSVTADVGLKFALPQTKVEEEAVNPPGVDNDRFFTLQWPLKAIDAAGAWNAGYRGAGATVAVLDSGVACAHGDIVAGLRHAAYAIGWKKLEPLWDAIIRARQATSMLPVLEAILSEFGRRAPARGGGAALVPGNQTAVADVQPLHLYSTRL